MEYILERPRFPVLEENKYRYRLSYSIHAYDQQLNIYIFRFYIVLVVITLTVSITYRGGITEVNTLVNGHCSCLKTRSIQISCCWRIQVTTEQT